jgi:hypothetical protein
MLIGSPHNAKHTRREFRVALSDLPYPPPPQHIGCQLKLHPALSASHHHIGRLRRSGRQRVITDQQSYLRPPAVLPTLFRRRNDDFRGCSIAFHIFGYLTLLWFYIVTKKQCLLHRYIIQLVTITTIRNHAHTNHFGTITRMVIISFSFMFIFRTYVQQQIV